jgi:hypothetical protein
MKSYLQFDLPKIKPLSLALNKKNQNDFDNELRRLLCFCIYSFSTKLEMDGQSTKNALTQVIYRYNAKCLPDWLNEICEDLGILEDYFGGFSGLESQTYEPDEGELKRLFNHISNKERMADFSQWYRINQAAEQVNINSKVSNLYEDITGRFSEVKAWTTDKSQPLIKLPISALFCFQNGEIDAYSLVMAMAISTTGKGEIYTTNKEHIICRMLGFISVNAMNEELETNQDLGKIYSKLTRYRIEKSFDELMVCEIIKGYSTTYSNGFKQSYNLSFTISQNALDIEIKRRKIQYINKNKINVDRNKEVPLK